MAYYRTVNIDFWQDVKVVDNFSPEDKYFMLYLLTNPKTNLIGCYELSIRTASSETGYNKETIERLLNRLKKSHNVIDYDDNTKEVIIFNWYKYNWTKSEKLEKALVKDIEKVKNINFKKYLTEVLKNRDTVSIPYPYPIDKEEIQEGYPMDTSVTVTGTVTGSDVDTVSGTDTESDGIYINIINHLNEKAGTGYKSTTPKTRQLIKARLNEEFKETDFYQVIDTKVKEWKNNKDMKQFLRPETLFGTKFESYLNQSTEVKREIIDLPFIDEEE